MAVKLWGMGISSGKIALEFALFDCCYPTMPFEPNLQCLPHDYEDLIVLFDECFYETHNTRLVRGDDEPIYLPASDKTPYHSVVFAHGYYRSALHEIAHWLIAGSSRRLQLDYGYWYAPDGRTASQQIEFEAVEAKPQALEWILSKAAGHPFLVSADNLSGESTDVRAFEVRVLDEVKCYLRSGLSERADAFRSALCHFYQTQVTLDEQDFSLSEFRL